MIIRPIQILYSYFHTEILNGVIKSIKKEGEWKVTFRILVFIFLFLSSD